MPLKSPSQLLTGAARRVIKRISANREGPRPEPKPRKPVFPGVRVAIIGAGRIAHHHLKVLKAFEGVRIVGICNRGRVDISGLAREYAIERTFSDWRVMLDETRPDAIFILVGPSDIASIAGAVLQRGIPCLIEKPAGLSPGETAHLANLAAKHRCLNMVGVNRRYYSVLENALFAVHEQGPLTGILIEANEPIAKLRRGSKHSKEVVDRWMFANSIHPIDLFRRCGGDILEIDASATSFEGGDATSYTASLRTTGGALGTFIAHWDSVPGWRLRLYGCGVRVTLDPLEQGEIEYSGGSRKPVPVDDVDVQFKPGFYCQTLAFLQSIVNDEPIMPPGSDLADQVKTMQLIERIFGNVEQAPLALIS